MMDTKIVNTQPARPKEFPSSQDRAEPKAQDPAPTNPLAGASIQRSGYTPKKLFRLKRDFPVVSTGERVGVTIVVKEDGVVDRQNVVELPQHNDYRKTR